MAEQSSIGVLIQYGTDGVNYTTFGKILDVDWPGAKKDVKEGTYLNQADRWKTFFGAFVDAGDITLKIKFDKAKMTTFLGYVDDQEPMYFRLSVPDGSDITDPTTCSRITTQGLVQDGPGLTFPNDGDKVVMPITLKLSGSPTWTPAP